MEKKKNMGIELLRILLCFLVILIHSRNSAYFNEHRLLDSVLKPIWFLCNSCFFMISGYYALSSTKILKVGGVQRYYKKKTLTVLLPLVTYSALYIVDERIVSGETIFSLSTLTDYLIRLSSNKVSFHLWFVYTLLGSLLAVPLLVFSFKEMSLKARNIVFLIGTVIMQAQILLSDFNIGFSVGYVLTGWLYIFCIGWFVDKAVSQKNEKWLYFGGGLGYFMTVLGMYFLPVYKNATDWALPHIVFSAAVFVLFMRHVSINGRTLGKIVTFVSRYTFPIYLIHVIVIRRLPSDFLRITTGSQIADHIWGAVRVFIVSFLIVVIIDYLLIRPTKYLFRRIIARKETTM